MRKKPFIGAIVHYEDGIYGTCAAIITHIYDIDKGDVHLAIFWPSGPPADASSNLLYAHSRFSAARHRGHWSWPPA